MSRIRSRLTYANVMSSLAVFLVLGGATAFAAGLAKNSVGSKQLKKNAVTTAKLKKNAITTAKIKANAVTTAKIKKNAIVTAKVKANAITTAKIKDAAVTGAKIDAGSTPFSQVTARLRLAGPVPLGTESPVALGAYAQPAGEDDLYMGGADVTFDAGCTAPRTAVVYLLIDPADPSKPSPTDLAGIGVVVDETGSSSTHRLNFVAFPGAYAGMQRFAPAATENHTFYLLPVPVSCKAGSGATAANFGIDVIGTK